MTISDAFAAWTETHRPEIPEDDVPMASESWNDFTDMLCKDGELTDLQYHYCPAYDDPMPGDADDERNYLLEAMGVKMTSQRIAAREDGANWPPDASHWTVTIARGEKSMTTPFSMGSAHTGSPDLADVLNCLISDWQTIEGTDDFEDYCLEVGEDDDSRAAEHRYKATVAASEALAALFSDINMDDLAALFEDF